jgi:hypothetical protein
MAAFALIRRELIAVLRTKRAFAMLVCIAAVATWLVLREWPLDPRELRAQSATISDLSSRIFAIALLLGGIVMLTPLAGAAITTERKRDTFAALRMALFRPHGIILAKLVNLLGLYTLLVIGCLPVLGVLFFLVGVSWQDLLLRITLVFATVFAAVSCGLYCSNRFSRTITANLFGFAGVLAMNGLISIVLVFLFSLLPLSMSNWLGYLAEALVDILPLLKPSDAGTEGEPIFLIVAITTPIFCLLPGYPMAPASLVGIYAALWQGFLGSFLLWRASHRLEHAEEVVRLRKDARVLNDAADPQRRGRVSYILAGPVRTHLPIANLSNPVFVRELRWGLPGRASTLLYVGYIVFLVSLAALGVFALDNTDSLTGVYTAGMLILILSCLLTPLMLANTFTKEYEGNRIDMLRMTLMLPAEITLGKFLGGVLMVVPLAALGLALILVAALFAALGHGFGALWLAAAAAVAFVVTTWLCLSVSMLASLIAKRTGSALLLSYALCVALLFGGNVAAIVAGEFIGVAVNGPGYREPSGDLYMFAAAFSPVVSYALLLLGWSKLFLVPLTLWVASMGGFFFLGKGIYRLAVRRFTRKFYSG